MAAMNYFNKLSIYLSPDRTTWRKYLEDCSIYIEIGTIF